MDNKESNSIAVIKTNVEWIMKTLDGISTELKSFPVAVDAINKRIDTTESMLQTLREKLDNHLVVATELIKEHQINTDFRKNSELLIRMGTWLVPGNVALSLIIGLLIFFKDKL